MSAPNENGPVTRSYSTFSGSPSVGEIGYEEFFGGAISCPTCHGSGRIPREQENELVALIPVRDKRLKPRRTTLYVILTIGLCLAVGGLLLFFLYPRAVKISSNLLNIKPDHQYINVSTEIVSMSVTAEYNFTNSNFFSITVEKLELTIFFDQKIQAKSTNLTLVHVPLRSTRMHYISANLTFEGDEGYIAHYCDTAQEWGHTLLMPFQATASNSYMGRQEETSLTTYEHVHCGRKDKRKRRSSSINNVIH